MDYTGRTMRTVSASEAKANLSKWLRVVSRGIGLVITLRGQPIARLMPVERSDAGTDEERLARLEKAGIIRRGKKKLDASFWALPRPRFTAETSPVRDLLEEREEGT